MSLQFRTGHFQDTTMTRLVIYILVLVTASAIHVKSSYRKGSVYCKSRSCSFEENFLDFDNAAAVGTFNDTLLVSGWGILDVKAGYATKGPKQDDADIMYAAGFIEGVFTAHQIEYNYQNLATAFLGGDPDLKQKLDKWMRTQREWAEGMIAKHKNDSLWRHASYIFAQLDGLYAGYRSVRAEANDSLDMFAFNFLNAMGDILDLQNILKSELVKDWRTMTASEARRYFYGNGHCSALIKLLPGYENIFMSHVSWFVYESTNRIYKHYNFNVQDPATAAKKVSFSSYPGFLESLDDFYHLGSGMVMLQTTNSVFNQSLYKLIKPQSLMAWQRVRIANMMAHSGREWTDIIAKYNSGTYNNQYMVIDLKLITLNKPLPDNTLWVAEQIPGLVVADDLTHELQYGYFPSYNIPYFEEIYNKSGYPDFVKNHGNDYSYQLAPRAKIFRRDQSTVKDLETMKAIMTYNDYKHDPYSGGSPFGAICGRGDLAVQAFPDGCYDAKVSDIKMAEQFEASIVNGPTLGTDLPPFSWTGNFTRFPHIGLPKVYDFPFIVTKPRFN